MQFNFATSREKFQKLKYIDSMYFVLVTAATLGYGDIYPNTIYSRFVVIIVLLAVFVIFG